MRTITTATEKRVNELKKTSEAGQELAYILKNLKARIGCYGSTIKQMKEWGEELANETQIDIVISNQLRGLAVNYPKYLNVVETHDLSYVTIRDFNGLVKAIACK